MSFRPVSMIGSGTRSAEAEFSDPASDGAIPMKTKRLEPDFPRPDGSMTESPYAPDIGRRHRNRQSEKAK